MTTLSNVIIDGVEYTPLSKTGRRAVVVIDRGWIYAGDVTRENGRIRLSRCVWVFDWSKCGFAAVIDDPSKGDLRAHADIDIPAGAEIFSVPVSDDWGLA
jgi:hypothetical protein